jgi:hypothetical protein
LEKEWSSITTYYTFKKLTLVHIIVKRSMSKSSKPEEKSFHEAESVCTKAPETSPMHDGDSIV